MLTSSLTALITFLVCMPAAVFSLRGRYTPAYRLLCFAVFALGLAKFFRFRPLADNHLEPALYRITTIHNLPIAAAAISAIAAYTAVLVVSLPRQRIVRPLLWAVGGTTAVFLTVFCLSYGSVFSGRPASDGLSNPLQAITWALPLLIVLTVNTAIAALSVSEIRRRPRGTRWGTPLGLLFVGIGGLLYVANKVLHLAVSTGNPDSPLLGPITFVGLIALPMSAVALALVIYSPHVRELINRRWRYRHLRRALHSISPRRAWELSADRAQTHALLVDTADDALTKQSRPDTAS
jgi:hypothetical protein